MMLQHKICHKIHKIIPPLDKNDASSNFICLNGRLNEIIKIIKVIKVIKEGRKEKGKCITNHFQKVSK